MTLPTALIDAGAFALVPADEKPTYEQMDERVRKQQLDLNTAGRDLAMLRQELAAAKEQRDRALQDVAAAVEARRKAEAARDRAWSQLALARTALLQDGYFRPEEVGDDIAPRITEWIMAMRDGAKVLAEDADRARDVGWQALLALGLVEAQAGAMRSLLQELVVHDQRNQGPWTRGMHERVQMALDGLAGLALLEEREQMAAELETLRARKVERLFTTDLAMLVRRLARRLPEGDSVAAQALDFLARKGVQGSVLRLAGERQAFREIARILESTSQSGPEWFRAFFQPIRQRIFDAMPLGILED